MSISVIIPTCRRAVVLRNTLNSLIPQTDRDFEVVVVCDGEDPQTRALSIDYTAEFPLTWIFTKERHGLPSARNTGANAAQGEILLFLDDDTEAVPDWISQHRKHLQTDKSQTLAVVGKIIDVFSREPKSHTERLLREERKAVLAYYETILTGSDVQSIGPDAESWNSFGVNCSISRKTFWDCGGFDPRLVGDQCGFIGEEMELGHRLCDRGIEFVFEPKAILYHHDSKDLRVYASELRKAAGPADVYRISEKGQRNAQTCGLTSLVHGHSVSRFVAWVGWNHPWAARRIAAISQALTDSAGMKSFYGIWGMMSFAEEYWQGVKAMGLTPATIRQLTGSPLPVLRFQSISVPQEPKGSPSNLSLRHFVRLMRWLRRLGYDSLPADERLSAPCPTKSILVTFDGGFEDFYSEVFPHLKPLGLKPLVFLVVDYIGKRNVWEQQAGSSSRKLLSMEQIREMSHQGVQFGSLTLTHPWLPSLSDTELRREVAESKSRLEDMLGSEVTCFAYPHGGIDSRVRAAVARAGYQFGFTTQPGLNFWNDPLALRRIAMNDSSSLLGQLVAIRTGRTIGQNTRAALLFGPRVALKFFPDSISGGLKRAIRQATS